MMTNLFSIFDPSSTMLSMSWMTTLLTATLLSMKMWKMKNPTMTMSNFIVMKMKNEVSFTMKKTEKSIETMIMMMFIMILVMNFMALFPHIFSLTSHLTVTLPLSLIMWLSIMMFGWTKNTNHMLTHLVPQGTPTALVSFMVLIEMISNMIRPITLCVRLTANLIAGHLLLTLLSNSMLITSSSTSIILMISPMLLTVLETAVACIQAYVFMTLVTMYTTEAK